MTERCNELEEGILTVLRTGHVPGGSTTSGSQSRVGWTSGMDSLFLGQKQSIKQSQGVRQAMYNSSQCSGIVVLYCTIVCG